MLDVRFVEGLTFGESGAIPPPIQSDSAAQRKCAL